MESARGLRLHRCAAAHAGHDAKEERASTKDRIQSRRARRHLSQPVYRETLDFAAGAMTHRRLGTLRLYAKSTLGCGHIDIDIGGKLGALKASDVLTPGFTFDTKLPMV